MKSIKGFRNIVKDLSMERVSTGLYKSSWNNDTMQVFHNEKTFDIFCGNYERATRIAIILQAIDLCKIEHDKQWRCLTIINKWFTACIYYPWD